MSFWRMPHENWWCSECVEKTDEKTCCKFEMVLNVKHLFSFLRYWR